MFKKQFFPDKTIQSLATNETVFERGQQIYEKEEISITKVDDTENNLFLKVADKDLEYSTQVTFYPNGVAKKYQCNCSHFSNYSGACKHVVASMYYLNSLKAEDLAGDIESITKKAGSSVQSDQSVKELFNISNELQDLNFDMNYNGKKEVHFEFILNISGLNHTFHFDLYMRIGIDHLYVIKNIPHVISQLLENHSYQFGKNFTFNPSFHVINPEDIEVLKQIQQIYNLAKDLNSRAYELSFTSKKELEIPDYFVVDLLKTLEDVDAGFVRFGRPIEQMSNIDGLTNIEFDTNIANSGIEISLSKHGNRFKLNITNYDPVESQLVFMEKAQLIYYRSVFYHLNSQEFVFIKKLFDIFKQNQYQGIILNENDLNEFIVSVYPYIQEIFNVYIDSDIEKLVIISDLTAHLYVDYADNQLQIQPIFRYQNFEINPLIEDNVSPSQQILVRKLKQEQQLLKKLQTHMRGYDKNEDSLSLEGTDTISTFIFNSLDELREDFYIYLTNEANELIFEPENERYVSLDIKPGSNLLEVSFDLGEIEEEDFKQIVQKLNTNKQSYHELKSGKLVNLQSKEFVDLESVLTQLDVDSQEVSQKMDLPAFKGLSLTDENRTLKSKRFEEMQNSLLEPSELEFEIPNKVQADLRDYQKTGYKWFKTLDYYHLGGILADDMGLGKTLQTITFLADKIENTEGNYLVVCPSSVLYNWQHEINKFAPHIDVEIISGDAAKRSEVIQNIPKSSRKVWLTSYPLVQKDGDYYSSVHFETIILDESQNVKNAGTKTAQVVRNLKSNNKFALSGTPIENNIDELFSIFSIVQPGLFKSKSKYRKLSNKEISEKIRPFILRRLKTEVLNDLPSKTETTEYIQLYEPQKHLYHAQLEAVQSNVSNLIEQNEFANNQMQILQALTRLRQICCDPRLLGNDFDQPSAKFDRLFEYLEEARTNGKRVVLFSQFTSMLKFIKEKLDKIGVDYHYLDGNTKNDDRLELTERFNKGEKDLFLISLKAGGTGLNLTGGDTVILYDSWWNPAVEEQAADRVHRFGQKNPVQIIRLITKGTIEERINELQKQKKELIDSVVNTQSESAMYRLSKEEILNILEI